jgi:hypothetical protein
MHAGPFARVLHAWDGFGGGPQLMVNVKVVVGVGVSAGVPVPVTVNV